MVLGYLRLHLTIMRPNIQQMARKRPLGKRPLGKRPLGKRHLGRGPLGKRHLRKRHLGRGPLGKRHLGKRHPGKTHLRWNSSPRMATCSGIHPPGQRRQSKRGKYH
ncbi:unnamed protein product [Boreogadus saida]